jgi:hypothetical protein
MHQGKRSDELTTIGAKTWTAKASRATAGAAILSAMVLGAVSGTTWAQSGKTVEVGLIAQDFSDCTNTTVKDDPNRIRGGLIKVSRQGDSTQVAIAMTANANTTYHFYLKCVRQLGDIVTDGEGVGTAVFNFSNASTGPVFAFDSYPEGAPGGNKFQSMTVDLR